MTTDGREVSLEPGAENGMLVCHADRRRQRPRKPQIQFNTKVDPAFAERVDTVRQ